MKFGLVLLVITLQLCIQYSSSFSPIKYECSTHGTESVDKYGNCICKVKFLFFK